MTSTKYNEAIELIKRFKEELVNKLEGLYRALRSKGFDRATTKQILETALKCGMVNEAFGEGVDSDTQSK